VRVLLAAGADATKLYGSTKTLLMLAVSSEDADTVDAVLSSGKAGDIEATDTRGQTALLLAAVRGCGPAVRVLLAAGADATKLDGNMKTLLMRAVWSGDADTVDAVLSSGETVDIDTTDTHGQTALHVAAASGQGSCVRVLLAAGADAARRHTLRLRTPLMRAALSGDADTVDAVLSSGKAVHINATVNRSTTALLVAVVRGCGSCVRLLLAAGADATRVDGEMTTMLMRAVESGDADTVDAVLSSGKAGDVDATDSIVRTALHRAAARGCGSCVRLLLAAGADATRVDGYMTTLLMHAVSSRDADTVDAVLSSGKAGDVDATDSIVRTALHLAAARGCGSAVRVLLAAGADATRVDGEMTTLLMHAVSSRDADTVDAVLSSGKAASIDTTKSHDKTALLLAAATGFGPGVRLLLAAGADPAVRSRRGTTALMHAAHCGCVDMMADLLSSGRCGDIDAMDVDGKTALAIAACRCHFGMTPAHQNYAVPRTASCLLDWGADPSSPFAFLASVPGRGYVIHSPAVDRLLRSRAVWRRRRRLVLWRRSCLASW